VRRLLTLAALLTGFALAQTPDNPEGVSSTNPSVAESQNVPYSGTNGALATLTCQVAAPSWAALCMVERPVWSVAGFAVTVGVEARAAYSGQLDGHVAGYITVSYGPPNGSWFAWVDVRTPEVAPALGTSDVLRVGFSTQLRWP